MIKITILLLTTLLGFQGVAQNKYTLDKHQIEFTVDSTWEYTKISDDTYSFQFKCDKDIAFCKNITIKIINNTDKQTIDQLAKTLVDYIPKRFNQYKILSVRDEYINSLKYKVIDYKFKQENIDLANTTLLTQRDNEFISIYFTALNQPAGSYTNERKLLFEVLKNFEVKSK